jgi:hypothetical protein
MLDSENRAQLLEQVGTQFSDTPSDTLTVDATSGGSIQEIKVEDVKVESTDPSEKSDNGVEQTVEVAESAADDGVVDDSPQKGHKVPYNRFKNVLESRNQFRSEVETYKEKLTSLEQKLANLDNSRAESSPSVEPEERTWLDDYLAEEQTADSPQWQKQYGDLNDRLYKFEVAQEEKVLKAELQTINEKYPNVPQNVLLKAIINDPNANINKVAEEYSTFMASIEEQAIARYLEQGGQDKAASPKEPLQRPRSTNAPRGRIAPPKKPSSVKGASNMLRDLLSKDNFLKS